MIVKKKMLGNQQALSSKLPDAQRVHKISCKEITDCLSNYNEKKLFDREYRIEKCLEKGIKVQNISQKSQL
jgi:hypothetical protein